MSLSTPHNAQESLEYNAKTLLNAVAKKLEEEIANQAKNFDPNPKRQKTEDTNYIPQSLELEPPPLQQQTNTIGNGDNHTELDYYISSI